MNESAVVKFATDGRRGNRQGRESQGLGSGGNVREEEEPRSIPAACTEPRMMEAAPDEGVQELLTNIAAHDDLKSRTLVEVIWTDLCDILAGCAGGFFGVGLNQDEHFVALVACALAVGFEALAAARSFLSALESVNPRVLLSNGCRLTAILRARQVPHP